MALSFYLYFHWTDDPTSPFKHPSGINSLMPFLCISQGKEALCQRHEIIPSPSMLTLFQEINSGP